MSRKAKESRIARNAKRRNVLLAVCCLLSFVPQAYSQSASRLQQGELEAKQHPQSAEAQNAWGEALDEAGQLEAARAAFERAVALKPGYGSAYLNLGLVS